MKDFTTIYLSAPALISAMGRDVSSTVSRLLRHESGVHVRQHEAVSDTAIPVGLIEDKDSVTQKSGNVTAFRAGTDLERLCMSAVSGTAAKAGVDLSSVDCGLVISTTKGNIDSLRQEKGLSPDSPAFLSHIADRLQACFKMVNTPVIISNACISGVSALIVARRYILAGRYKHVVVVGADVLSHFITSGFLSFKSVSKRRCLPYDKRHDGLNLGEACGALLVSCERHSEEDIILAGGAITNDAHHISAPSRTGDGLGLAIKEVMAEAGTTPEDVSFVNAHGTATVYNDEMEARAVHLAGLQQVPVNSTKPYFGHTLGASGVVDTILCMWELNHQTLFGTLGFEELGVSVPLKVSGEDRDLPMKACVKTASGFGGCNAAVVLMRTDFANTLNRPEEKCHFTPAVSLFRDVEMTNGCVKVDGEVVFEAEDKRFSEFIRQAFAQSSEQNIKFYKKDDLAKLGYMASLYLLDGVPVEPERTGIVLANASASLHADMLHEQVIEAEGDKGARPSVFVYTLPNVTAGEICIRHGIRGENTFFIYKEYSAGVMKELEQYAAIVMAEGKLDTCIVGWCELLDDDTYQAVFKLINKK